MSEIDAALVLFRDAFGLTMVDRRSSDDPAGEIAILDAGGVAVTLLQPADHGPGFVVERREPRLTQLVFAAGTDDTAQIRMAVGESGIPTLPFGESGFYVTPHGCQGLFGFEVATVVTSLSQDGPD